VWKPFIFTLLVMVGVVALGVRTPIAFVAFFVIAFAISLTIYEYGREVYARHRGTGESVPEAFWKLAGRNRRRYGGFIIHLSMAIMALGVVGIELFQVETQGTLPQGGSLKLAGYTVTFKDLAVFDTPDGKNVARAVVGVSKNGQFLGDLYPRRDYYYESQQPMTIPGVRSNFEDDLYIILVDWQPISSGGTTFKVYHNPLVSWLWTGSLIFILGTLVAAWPGWRPRLKTRKWRRRKYEVQTLLSRHFDLTGGFSLACAGCFCSTACSIG
jgi:cytochrome c-type biogenesis protein CcmF